jgi:hypothetical protein
VRLPSEDLQSLLCMQTCVYVAIGFGPKRRNYSRFVTMFAPICSDLSAIPWKARGNANYVSIECFRYKEQAYHFGNYEVSLLVSESACSTFITSNVYNVLCTLLVSKRTSLYPSRI